MNQQIGTNDLKQEAAATLHIHLGCEFRYETAAGVEFVVLVEPPRNSGRARELRSQRSAEPEQELRQYEDGFGNRCWRVTSAGDALTLRYDATYAVPDAPDEVDFTATQVAMAQVPNDVLLYTLPSRYCQSDLLLDDAWSLFGNGAEGYGRVQAICDWVHSNVSYSYSGSGPSVSAVDTMASRQGVCRDFAHLPVALCRALNIPARYVFGYLPDYAIVPDGTPMDFHAWFEAFLGEPGGEPGGGRWYTFDARHNIERIGRVKIAHGRDAVDVAMVTSFGMAKLASMIVWTDAEPADDPLSGAKSQE